MKLLKTKLVIYAILLFGFLGFLDSAYLTILHYKDAIPPCTVTNGCETVLTSSYSQVFGIPIAFFGAGFYLSVIGVSILLLTNPKSLFFKALYVLADAGMIVSIILIYIQFAILKTSCQYCLFSELTSLGIFIAAILIWKNKKSIK
ncbi:MAG: vitamin K epoxide reductase family protein [Patescibacteria group bacterium]